MVILRATTFTTTSSTLESFSCIFMTNCGDIVIREGVSRSYTAKFAAELEFLLKALLRGLLVATGSEAAKTTFLTESL